MRKRKTVNAYGLVLLLLILAMIFLVFLIRAKHLGELKTKSIMVTAKGENEVINFKSPLVKEIDQNIEEKNIEKRQDELTKVQQEKKQIREEKERKIQLEKRLEREKQIYSGDNSGKKIAYLTFDDGPSSKSTPAILDILKKENIRGTFFVLGKMVDTYPDLVKRISQEGHSIGHHSYTHNYDYIYGSTENFMSEIDKTNESLKRILGDEFKTNIVRFPGGAYPGGSNGNMKMAILNDVESIGYINYNWNALNGDSEGHNLPREYLMNRLKTTVGDKDRVIILMHDTDAKPTTVDSLPETIQYLKDRGYTFETLN